MHAPAATPIRADDASEPATEVTYAPPRSQGRPTPAGSREASFDRGTPAPVGAANPASNYLRTKVMTATPEQLQLMLYDGAIRFAEQGRAALEAKQYDQSFTAFTRAQNIVTELQCTLRPEMSPEVCRNLASLYTFAYMRLVEANLEHDVKHVDEALQVLRYQRETWVLLMQEQSKEKAARVASTLEFGREATETVERLSIQG